MLIVFDLDDTLYPEIDYVRSGFEAVGKWLEAECGLEGFAPCAQAEFCRGNRTHVFDAVLEQLGCSRSVQIVPELVAVYRGHEPNIALWPDADLAIDVLSRGHSVAMITDGYRVSQHNKIKSLGLEVRLEPIVVSDELGGRDSWKPSVIPYQKIVELSDSRPGKCVYIGDNPLKDFVTPRQLGWSTIRIRRYEQLHWAVEPAIGYESDFEIPSMATLPELIDRLSVELFGTDLTV